MPINVMAKPSQVNTEVNEGEIFANKPVGFPADRGQLKPYSSIYYISNHFTEEGSTINEHPHQGFEIFSMIAKGNVDYIDSIKKEWKRLTAGDFQVIKAGKGIKHAQRMHAGSQILEYWFNPDLRTALLKEPVIIDHKGSDFDEYEMGKMKVKTIVGSGSNFDLETKDVKVKEITFFHGNHSLNLEPTSLYSCYMVKGNIEVNNTIVDEDDFMTIVGEQSLEITAGRESKIIMVETSKELAYRSYAQLYAHKYKAADY